MNKSIVMRYKKPDIQTIDNDSEILFRDIQDLIAAMYSTEDLTELRTRVALIHVGAKALHNDIRQLHLDQQEKEHISAKPNKKGV